MLIYVVPIALMIYALIDCIQATEVEVGDLPRPVWLLIIILLPVVGPIAWLVVSRSHRNEARRSAPRQVPPDEDPEFLQWLARREERRKRDGWTGDNDPSSR